MVKFFFIFIIYLAFVSIGLPDTGFSVAWNQMRLDLGLPLDIAGVVNMVVTTCGAISGFFSYKITRKLGAGKLTAFSCLLTAIAILGYSISTNLTLVILFSMVTGFGAGAVDTSLNSYVSENLSEKHMNWLHCFWGVGVTLAPILMSQSIVYSGWRFGFLVIGVIQLSLTVLLFLSLPLWKNKKIVKKNNFIPDRKLPKLTGFLSPLTFFLYVAIEGGLGFWLNSLMVEFRGLSVESAGVVVSCYYGAIMAGRFLGGFFATKLGNIKLTYIGFAVTILGASLFLAGSPALFAPSVFLIGLGFAPFYPCQMHQTTKRYGSLKGQQIISRQVFVAYIGTLVFVPLIGFFGRLFTLEFLPALVLIVVVILAITQLLLDRVSKKEIADKNPSLSGTE